MDNHKTVGNFRRGLKYQLSWAEEQYARACEFGIVDPELGKIERNLIRLYKQFHYLDFFSIMILDDPAGAGDVEHVMNAAQMMKNKELRANEFAPDPEIWR